jgi:hypothetical protein
MTKPPMTQRTKGFDEASLTPGQDQPRGRNRHQRERELVREAGEEGQASQGGQGEPGAAGC